MTEGEYQAYYDATPEEMGMTEKELKAHTDTPLARLIRDDLRRVAAPERKGSQR